MMWGSSGNKGQVMRWPGPHQGAIVCAHTQMGHGGSFCHKLIPTAFTEPVNLWSRGRIPF